MEAREDGGRNHLRQPRLDGRNVHGRVGGSPYRCEERLVLALFDPCPEEARLVALEGARLLVCIARGVVGLEDGGDGRGQVAALASPQWELGGLLGRAAAAAWLRHRARVAGGRDRARRPARNQVLLVPGLKAAWHA